MESYDSQTRALIGQCIDFIDDRFASYIDGSTLETKQKTTHRYEIVRHYHVATCGLSIVSGTKQHCLNYVAELLSLYQQCEPEASVVCMTNFTKEESITCLLNAISKLSTVSRSKLYMGNLSADDWEKLNVCLSKLYFSSCFSLAEMSSSPSMVGDLLNACSWIDANNSKVGRMLSKLITEFVISMGHESFVVIKEQNHFSD